MEIRKSIISQEKRALSIYKKKSWEFRDFLFINK